MQEMNEIYSMEITHTEREKCLNSYSRDITLLLLRLSSEACSREKRKRKNLYPTDLFKG